MPQGTNISFNLYWFYLLIYLPLSRPQGPGPFGCDSGEPKLHLPSATGSALPVPAAGQVSLAMVVHGGEDAPAAPKMGKSSRSLSRFGV